MSNLIFPSAFKLIDVQEVSNVASVELEIPQSNSDIIIQVIDLIPVTDNTELRAQISEDGGSTYKNTGYDTMYTRQKATSITDGFFSSASEWALNYDSQAGNLSSEGLASYIYLDNPTNANRKKTGHFVTNAIFYNDGELYRNFGSLFYDGTPAPYNAIEFYMTSGNISSAKFNLWSM